MKLPALALLLLTSQTMLAQAAKPQAKIHAATAGKALSADAKSGAKRRKLLEFYEREMIEAEHKHNWEAIARRLAPDFLEIAGDGKVYNKEQVAAYFPDVRLNKYTISEMEVRVVDANAGIVAYKIEVDATFKGQPIPGAARVSSVWARQNGAWLMKFHQATPIPK